MLRFVFCVIKNSTAHACIMSAILQTIQSMIGLSKLQSLQVLALKPLQTPLSDKTTEMFQWGCRSFQPTRKKMSLFLRTDRVSVIPQQWDIYDVYLVKKSFYLVLNLLIKAKPYHNCVLPRRGAGENKLWDTLINTSHAQAVVTPQPSLLLSCLPSNLPSWGCWQTHILRPLLIDIPWVDVLSSFVHILHWGLVTVFEMKTRQAYGSHLKL